MNATRYMWSVTFRNAKGETMGLSCADPRSLLEEALRFNAVTVTLFREKKLGRRPSLDEVQGIFTKE